MEIEVYNPTHSVECPSCRAEIHIKVKDASYESTEGSVTCPFCGQAFFLTVTVSVNVAD